MINKKDTTAEQRDLLENYVIMYFKLYEIQAFVEHLTDLISCTTHEKLICLFSTTAGGSHPHSIDPCVCVCACVQAYTDCVTLSCLFHRAIIKNVFIFKRVRKTFPFVRKTRAQLPLLPQNAAGSQLTLKWRKTPQTTLPRVLFFSTPGDNQSLSSRKQDLVLFFFFC